MVDPGEASGLFTGIADEVERARDQAYASLVRDLAKLSTILSSSPKSDSGAKFRVCPVVPTALFISSSAALVSSFATGMYVRLDDGPPSENHVTLKQDSATSKYNAASTFSWKTFGNKQYKKVESDSNVPPHDQSKAVYYYHCGSVSRNLLEKNNPAYNKDPIAKRYHDHFLLAEWAAFGKVFCL
jgi:hypothetical protein